MNYTLLVAAHPSRKDPAKMNADEEQRYYEKAQLPSWVKQIAKAFRQAVSVRMKGYPRQKPLSTLNVS